MKTAPSTITIFKRADAYGDTLDSYDILKLIALATMVIDHLGAFFWPDAEWMRAIGRIAFPLFLFLVGYSGAWKVKADLLLSAVLVVLSTALIYHRVFLLDILVTIAITRYVMGWLTRWLNTPWQLACVFLICIIWFPLMYWYDYSTVAVLFAISGYLQRQQPRTPVTLTFLYAVLALHFIIQYMSYVELGFHPVTFLLWLLPPAFITAGLMHIFRLQAWNGATVSAPVRHVLQWIARNTLPLYVLHIILFMAIHRVCCA